MKVYEFQPDRDDPCEYFGTLAETKTRGKELPASLRPGARVREYDVPTDKAAIIQILNGHVPTKDVKPLRSWSVTPRGGLAELES